MNQYKTQLPTWWTGQPKNETPRIEQAVLFMNPIGNSDTEFDLLFTGVRCLDANKNVLRPQQIMDPGDYYLAPCKPITWIDLLAWVRADIPRVAEALALKDIADPTKRNQAIFTWIEQHFFSQGIKVARGPGWAELEYDIFEWVMDSCRVEDCWRASKLRRKMTGHFSPVSRYATDTNSFASVAGREFLSEICLDPQQSLADRQMALAHLSCSLWPSKQRKAHPSLVEITPDEQLEIIREISPLLKDTDRQMREYAARTLGKASSLNDGNRRDRDTKAALPALAEAWQAEPPGYVRSEMAEIIIRLGGEDYWQKLSGNPHGMLVKLHSF
ncbi:MAG: HEAT repeat domain-containing protein, partial [Planctomycetales bacterium]